MSRPLITIGITSFNAEASILKAVESALAQKWRPIEIVIVDDCSDDDTPNLLNNLSERHPEIRVYGNRQNGGVAVSRNHLLKEARGEFLVFFDDDDESLPERLDIQYERLTAYEKEFANGSPVICHSARNLVYENGERRIAPTMGQRLGCMAPSGQGVVNRILLGTPLRDGLGDCPTCSQMARLKTYLDLGCFDPELRRSEDTDFNVRLAAAGGHFAGVAKPLVTQYMTKTSDKNLADEHRFMLMVLAKNKDLLEHQWQYNFARRWLDCKYQWLEGDRGRFLQMLLVLILNHPLSTLKRLAWAAPNFSRNKAFGRFHTEKGQRP